MFKSFSLPHSRAAKTLALAALVAGSFIAGCAVAAQPHMNAALAALRNAKAELSVAEHNKGGHRAQALSLVDNAIRQVELGIQAGQ